MPSSANLPPITALASAICSWIALCYIQTLNTKLLLRGSSLVKVMQIFLRPIMREPLEERGGGAVVVEDP